jgi:multidrug efflux pump subunit AcrB
MSRFAIRNPYFIVVLCLIVLVVGVTSTLRMPVDLFPPINIPEVVVATFYSGMPPQTIEAQITGTFERFFTLGSGIDHMESRSLPGVSIIKVYFQAGTNADTDASEISNLAMADLRRLPAGTLPPVVLKFDASSLPVCLVTLQGKGLGETQLRDLGQYTIRNQIATAPGASVPPPFGGRYRQIMIYVDPDKLQAYNLSPMDIVRAVNEASLTLPAGDVKIGPYDYELYTNSEVSHIDNINYLPLKTVDQNVVRVKDIGIAKDASAIQTNIVRVDGQNSVYLPILKQGGNANTIAVVNNIRKAVTNLFDVPRQLKATIVFDQSKFVKQAIESVLREGGIGLLLTGLMVLIFLGSLRATAAVFLSIPLSALAVLILLQLGGSTINSMVLAGLAIVFSRLIDNSVIVLENIFRHMEMGEPPAVAAENGASEVALAVLAATLTSGIVFFPVTLLTGVSKFLFSALALAVVLALAASYFVAMTVVPLFCAKLIKAPRHAEAADHSEMLPAAPAASEGAKKSWGERFNTEFNRRFHGMLDWYEARVDAALLKPRHILWGTLGIFVLSLGIYPLLGVALFPRSDAGQFVVNLKAPSGTRIELTEQLVKQAEDIIRNTVQPHDLHLIVSNIGLVSGFSALYTSNSGSHTATIQVALSDGHKIGSYRYMDMVRQKLREQLPQVTTFFQSGGIQDAVLNQGLPAPIDVQVTGNSLKADNGAAQQLAREIRHLGSVSDVYIPQNLDYPAIQINVNRVAAGEMGLSQKEVVDNIITALTNNGMIAPNYWIDPRNGNSYLLTVQYPEQSIRNVADLKSIPLRASDQPQPTLLESVADLKQVEAPTEVDHYQIQRVIDIYVNPAGEDLGRIANGIQKLVSKLQIPSDVRVTVRGNIEVMRQTFKSFAIGLALALALLYLILVAQFRSALDPLLIVLAVPPALTGVLVCLFLTGTTVNVQSLMGVIMMVGMVVSNSILIVEFAHRLDEEGMSVRDAIVSSCRIRLRPILMTSLATIFGLIPMALKLGEGSEVYAPLGRAIIGGLMVSVIVTVFVVPAAYLLAYGRQQSPVPVETGNPQ